MLYKRNYIDLVIDSDEELGILDTTYLEDYTGIDGQLTLYHVSSDWAYDILMAEVAGGGPYDHDHFEGSRSASAMPLGAYEIRGRVRDIAGNYTILSAFQTPLGTERVIPLGFNLVPYSPYVIWRNVFIVDTLLREIVKDVLKRRLIVDVFVRELKHDNKRRRLIKDTERREL